MSDANVKELSQNVSANAVSLARATDRLAPGEYLVILHKQPDRIWQVSIIKTQSVQKMTLEKQGQTG